MSFIHHIFPRSWFARCKLNRPPSLLSPPLPLGLLPRGAGRGKQSSASAVLKTTITSRLFHHFDSINKNLIHSLGIFSNSRLILDFFSASVSYPAELKRTCWTLLTLATWDFDAYTPALTILVDPPHSHKACWKLWQHRLFCIGSKQQCWPSVTSQRSCFSLHLWLNTDTRHKLFSALSKNDGVFIFVLLHNRARRWRPFKLFELSLAITLHGLSRSLMIVMTERFQCLTAKQQFKPPSFVSGASQSLTPSFFFFWPS